MDISVTIDVWTSRDMRLYVGITAHYVEDYDLQSGLLTYKCFKGAHAAENIQDTYDKVLASYRMTGKVHTTISDNALNMICTFVTLPNLATTQDGDEEGPEPAKEPEGDPSLLEYMPQHYPSFIQMLYLVAFSAWWTPQHWPDRPSAG